MSQDFEKIATDLLPCLFTFCTPDSDKLGELHT